jgi:hypothetical protein
VAMVMGRAMAKARDTDTANSARRVGRKTGLVDGEHGCVRTLRRLLDAQRLPARQAE